MVQSAGVLTALIRLATFRAAHSAELRFAHAANRPFVGMSWRVIWAAPIGRWSRRTGRRRSWRKAAIEGGSATEKLSCEAGQTALNRS